VPLGERLGAARFVLALRRAGFRAGAHETVQALLRAHRQDGRMGHFLWRPLCISALNTPPERAAAGAFLAVLRDTLGGTAGASDLLLPRVDLSRLFPEPAAAWLAARGGELRLNARVRELESLRRDYAAVVIAVGPHQLAALAPGLAPDFEYQPITTCYLQYPEQVRLPLPMLGLDAGLVQWVFDRGALLGERGRLACVISAQGDHQQMEHDELGATCARELAQALPRLPAPLSWRVIAEKRATVACTPGLVRPGPATQWPEVFLAGDYTDPEYPPTLEAAARSGVRAAGLCYARIS
ncbi:MAG: hydroxysqualene dehydroxylase HpnE, partial [Burkholderiales bacterium]